jgi:hypothetical protein
LLFFFVLALGVLLGAEFNAAIEDRKPAKVRPPRVLDPRNWQMFQGDDAPPAEAGTADVKPAQVNGTDQKPARAKSLRPSHSRKLS